MKGAAESSARRRRWWPFVAAALLAIALAVYVAAPWLARPVIERAATAALGVPVSIENLRWQPFTARFEADGVAVGGEGEQIVARSLAVALQRSSLLRGAIVVDRVEVDAPSGTARFDAQFRLSSPSFTGAEAEPRPDASQIAIREVVVTDGKFVLVYPLGERPREVKLDVARFVASDIVSAADGSLAMHARFDGAIHDAPLTADTTLRFGGDDKQIGGEVSVTGFVFSGDVLPLPQEFAGLTGELDATATYARDPETGTPVLMLGLVVKRPQLSGEADTSFAAKLISLPLVRVDPVESRIDLGTIEVDSVAIDAVLTDTGMTLPVAGTVGPAAPAGTSSPPGSDSPWTFVAGAVELRGGEVRLRRGEVQETLAIQSGRLEGFEPGRRNTVALEGVLAGGGTLGLEGALGLVPPDADLTLTARDLALPNLARLLPPLPLELEQGKGAAKVRLTYEKGNLGVNGRVEARDMRLAQRPSESGAAAAKVAAKVIALPQLRIDLAKREIDFGAVEVDSLVLDAILGDSGLTVPILPVPAAPAAAPPAPASEWKVAVGPIQLRNGEVQLQRGEVREAVTIRSAQLRRFEPERRTPLALEARLCGTGVVEIDGELGLEPLDAALTIRAREVSLPVCARLLPPLPLQLEKGKGDADLRLTYRQEKLRLSGTVEARDLRTVPPRPERTTEVLAVHVAKAEIAFDPAATPMLDVPSLELSYPYAMVQRHADELFPYSVFIGADADPAGEALRPRPTMARLGRLTAEGGKLEFMDMTLTPPYWTALSEVALKAEGILLPQATIAHFDLAARHDELSPVQVSGSFTESGLAARAEMKDVLLESMNAYVSPLLGYRVTAGRMSMTGVAKPSASSLESVVEVVVRGIDVLQTGTDVIQQESGVPLPIALSLISSISGQIDLSLPISFDTESRQVSLGSVIGQAVRRAIVAALTSPLRLLGSLFGKKGAPHAFALAPVPFATGSGDLDEVGRARIGEIARIVEKHQGLLVVTLPQLTEADIAAVGAAEAPGLADERQAAVREALTEDALGPQLSAARLLPSAWTPATGAKATGQPGVYVELQDAP